VGCPAGLVESADPMDLLILCSVAYLLGAIPFALVSVKLLKGVDIRRVGSGNVGATNASRAFGPGARLPIFVLIYLLDFSKGFLPTWFAPEVAEGVGSAMVLAGTAAVLGHCTSPYLGFRGGKGVATTTGVIAVLDWVALLVALATWLIVRFATRQVFLGSLALGLALPVTVIVQDPVAAFAAEGKLSTTIFCLGVALFFFFTHRSNIKKMFKGGAMETTK